MIEKMASGLRFVKRGVQADLARFKAYVEMEDAEGLQYRAVRGNDESGRGRRDRADQDSQEDDRRQREGRRQERREAAAPR
jgi:hypothetical protein